MRRRAPLLFALPFLLVGASSCGSSKEGVAGTVEASRVEAGSAGAVGPAETSLEDSGAVTPVSASCTALTGTSGSILDAAGNTWTLAAAADGTLVIDENAALAGTSLKVTELLYVNGVIAQRNAWGDWWSWTGSTWVAAADPSGTCASDGGSRSDGGSADGGPATDAGHGGGDGGSSAQSPYIPAGYTLTMSDEFDDPTETFPNAKFYTTYHYFGDIRTLSGNDELEVYVDPAYKGSCATAPGVNPFVIANGVLSLTAAPITAPAAACYGTSFKYTSGLLDSVMTQQYGYWELRAKMPAGKGLWPAFWMDAFDNGGLEMDIFEMLEDNTTRIYQTNHGSTNDQQTVYTGIDTTDGFHTYGFEWTADTITWVVDGVVTRTSPSYFAEPTDFMINLATGGSWGGDPNGSTAFPAQMQLDYVRVYQKP